MNSETDAVVMRWVQDSVGTAMLAYLLGCEESSVAALVSGDEPLSEKQTEVVGTFRLLRTEVPSEIDDVGAGKILRHWLTQVGDDGKVIARSIHDHVVPGEELPIFDDPIENALAALAADAFSAFLLTPDPDLKLPGGFALYPVNIEATRLLFQHPAGKTFADAVLGDNILKRKFAVPNESVGFTAQVYTNTGSGEGIQLSMLAERILKNAWHHLPDGEATLPALIERATLEFRQARKLFSGKPVTIPVSVGLTGVLLPADTRLEIAGGVLRSTTDKDRELVPESLKGQLTSTDNSGVTTVINYDGDVVFETPFSFRTKSFPGHHEAFDPWPLDFRELEALERTITRLRFSLMLAVERETRAQLVATWRFYDEPMAHGRRVGWYDPRQGAGNLMPTQLTVEELNAWHEWYALLDHPYVDNIEIALTRILRAVAERRDSSDVLIDSVIAWENLLGSAEGELSFRVTACFAKLLETTVERRDNLRKELVELYRLRSKVVHGGGNLTQPELRRCQETLDYAIRVVRILLKERPDILALPNGTRRSAMLLLEG